MMLSSLFKPKNTFINVAIDIGKGLEENTVFLTDQDLDEAGYEVSEGLSKWHLSYVLVYVLVFDVFLLKSAQIILSIMDSKYEELVYTIFVIFGQWLVLLPSIVLFPATKKRLITKKSSRR